MLMLPDHFFLLSDVPGDVALGVGGFGAAAILGEAGFVAFLVRQILSASASRNREDQYATENANLKLQAAANAERLAELTREIANLQLRLDERRRADERRDATAG